MVTTHADNPDGTGGGSVEPSELGAAVALDVPVYRSAARVVGAVRDDGVWEPSTAAPAGLMP